MSQENVEAVERAREAANRGDIEALLEELDPDVEWHPAMQALLGGEATVYRRHEGVREMFRDFYGAFAELHVEVSRTEDLGDRVVSIGRLRARGKESGAQIESAWGSVTEVKNGKGIRVWTYLDHKEALSAAGLSEQAMSQENLERVHQAHDAFNRRDLDAFLALMDSEVELTTRFMELEGDPYYRGHDGVREWWRTLLGVFPDFSTEVLEVRDLGDPLIVAVRVRGHGFEGGAPFEEVLWQAVKLRDGKATWWRNFASEAEALEAAGLEE